MIKRLSIHSVCIVYTRHITNLDHLVCPSSPRPQRKTRELAKYCGEFYVDAELKQTTTMFCKLSVDIRVRNILRALWLFTSTLQQTSAIFCKPSCLSSAPAEWAPGLMSTWPSRERYSALRIDSRKNSSVDMA